MPVRPSGSRKKPKKQATRFGAFSSLRAHTLTWLGTYHAVVSTGLTHNAVFETGMEVSGIRQPQSETDGKSQVYVPHSSERVAKSTGVAVE